MGSQHFQRTTATVEKVTTKECYQLYGKPAFTEDDTTATVGKVAKKGRKQLYGKPAFVADDSNSRKASQPAAHVLFNLKYQRRHPFERS
jgi:hypothetical protein